MGVTASRRATAAMVTAARPSSSAIARLAANTAARSICRGRAMGQSSHTIATVLRIRYIQTMRVLLSDGSGLTSRQAAGLVAAAGHDVGVLSSEPWCLCRLTRAVHRIHPVPAVGGDPFAWLDTALD